MNSITLIHKVLSGHASELEKADFNKWIESDPANKQDFEDIKFLIDNAEDSENNVDPNDSFYDGLRKIKSTIELLKARNKKIKLYRVLCLILVGVILSFNVSTYLFDWNPYKKNQIDNSVGGEGYNVGSKILTDPLKFDDVLLSELFRSLETNYDLVIIVKSNELLSCRFTGSFSKGVTIDHIMHSISKAIDFECTAIQEDKYEIQGRGC